jgi:uncharacterized membrane protein
MKILNLINPIRNTFHRLATACFAVLLAALATTPARSQVIVGGDSPLYKPGRNTISATLTGADVYVLSLASIPYPTAPTSLTVSFGTGNYRGSTTESGETFTISTMVGGPKSGTFSVSLYADTVEITPSSVVNQTRPLHEDFQMISRTHGASAFAAHVGQTTKIRTAIPDAITVNRVTLTANPAVFLVGVTSAEAEILRLQVMAGACLTENSSFASS